jgi:hypothetical protein
VFAREWDRGVDDIERTWNTTVYDEEGAMADEGVSAYHHQHHIPLPPSCIFFTPRHYDQNAWTLGRGYLLQAHFELPLDGGYKHGTVIQHHHDQHRSLHHKAYLRNALKLITRFLSR